MDNELEMTIEKLVDQHSLCLVLSKLVDICHGKAQHLEENWQDKNAAKAWDSAAKAIDKAKAKAFDLEL